MADKIKLSLNDDEKRLKLLTDELAEKRKTADELLAKILLDKFSANKYYVEKLPDDKGVAYIKIRTIIKDIMYVDYAMSNIAGTGGGCMNINLFDRRTGLWLPTDEADYLKKEQKILDSVDLKKTGRIIIP